MRKLTLLLAVLSLPVLVALGCGNDEGASSSTSLAPAGALAYGEVDLEPSGDQKQAIDALAAKFPGQGSAGERLRSLIEKGLRSDDAPISFEDDVEPWLGDSAAFFVKGVQGQAAAGLIATTDEDASRDALEKAFEGDGREKTYEDVEYLVEGDSAGGVVDGFLVVGNEAGFKAAVDTSEGGEALDGDERYEEATSDIAEDRLGLVYANMPALFESVRRQPGAQALGSFDDLFKEPIVTTFDADRDGVGFESDTPGTLATTLPFLGEGSDLIEELPADSWLALAQPDLGKVLDAYIEAFGRSVGGRDVIASQFRAATGLDLDQDVLGWMGDFAVFVRGTSLSELNGAVVIETTDPEASQRLLGRLEQLARRQPGEGTSVGRLSVPGGGQGFTLRNADVPAPVHVFQRGDRVVVAYGDAAAEDALSPGERLGESSDFTDAAQSIDGYDVSFYLATAPVLGLVDSAAAGDADWASARPYLEPLAALVGGTAGDNDELRSAFKILVD
jgi:hypothetical protein